MKNDRLLYILEDLGLTENEARLYLASLSLGPTTVLSLAKTAEIRRTTVYSIIEALKKKGLMHIEITGFKKLYVAEHPDKLEAMIENKKSVLEKAAPEFLALYNLKGKESTVKYYEGIGAIKTIYDEVLQKIRPGDEYLVISDLQRFFDQDRAYFDNYLEKLQKNHSHTAKKILATPSPQADFQKKYSKNFNNQIKILPKTKKLSVDVMILPYAVTIFDLNEPLSAIRIENQSVIDLHKEMFEIMWNALPE